MTWSRSFPCWPESTFPMPTSMCWGTRLRRTRIFCSPSTKTGSPTPCWKTMRLPQKSAVWTRSFRPMWTWCVTPTTPISPMNIFWARCMRPTIRPRARNVSRRMLPRSMTPWWTILCRSAQITSERWLILPTTGISWMSFPGIWTRAEVPPSR